MSHQYFISGEDLIVGDVLMVSRSSGLLMKAVGDSLPLVANAAENIKEGTAVIVRSGEAFIWTGNNSGG